MTSADSSPDNSATKAKRRGLRHDWTPQGEEFSVDFFPLPSGGKIPEIERANQIPVWLGMGWDNSPLLSFLGIFVRKAHFPHAFAQQAKLDLSILSMEPGDLRSDFDQSNNMP